MVRGVSGKKLFVGFLLVLTTALLSRVSLLAESIPNSSSACADVLMIFARGSGDNPNGQFLNLPYGDQFIEIEKVPGAFFQAFKNKMDNEYPKVTYKAVSVHNFPNLYNSNGYKAVGAFGATTFFNAVQAEYSWFPLGEYNRSIGDGKEETAGYVKDQISLCPNQQLVLGGYSQGAQVMGESTFMLSSTERQRVAALALFGDPKYVGSDIGSSSSTLNWFDSGLSFFTRPKAKPWKRGSAGLGDRGLADARIPYLPSDMENKTLSWCFNDDFVCSGGSGIFQTIISSIPGGSVPSPNDYSNGHNRYATFGAPQAAKEIVQRLAPFIADLDKSRGGIDPAGPPSQPVPSKTNNKPIDIMMMLNTSAGVDDVLGQMRFSTSEVLTPMYAYFSEALYGIGEYSETGDLPNRRVPRVSLHLNPTRNIDSLVNKMYRPLAFGGQSGGGLDPADPHQIGIERAVMSTNWRQEAEKHIVVISNRLPSSTYTYNVCNSDVRIGFGNTTANNCNVNPSLETDLAKTHSERCSKVYDVLTRTNCAVEMANPFHTYNVVRKTDDAIALAQAKGIMVDVVVPSTITQFYDSTTGITYTVPVITAALKKIADSTGGVFLQYSSFTKANYTDMYWRILNHKSRVIPFAAVEDFDTAGSVDEISASKPKTIPSQLPILFDAGSANTFDQYKWDFNGDGVWDETTYSPNTDFVYDSAVGGVLAVVAGFNGDVEQSRSVLPLNITLGEETQLLAAPELPGGLEAVRDGDDVVISWTAVDSETVLFIGDPTSGLPVISSPLSSGNITLAGLDNSNTSILVWVDDELSSSTREELAIEEEPEPVVVIVVEPEPEEQVLLPVDDEESEETVVVEPELEEQSEVVVVVDTLPSTNDEEPEEELIVDDPQPTVEEEPEVVVEEENGEEDTKVLVESESNPNSQFLGEQSSTESTAQSNNSNNTDDTPSAQQVVQSANPVTEVKSETQSEVLQQASDLSDEELATEIDEVETKESNSALYVILVLLLALLVGAGAYKVVKSKD